MECVTTVHYTLLINGNITQSFTPSKGLRQRDPLSPYLLLMFANILYLSLMKAKNQRNIKGLKLGRNCISFTHIFFADDSLIFFKKATNSLTSIQEIMS